MTIEDSWKLTIRMNKIYQQLKGKFIKEAHVKFAMK